jgi:RNA polymerase subunit RPABC4/transcription elongation factor Spt4
MVKGCPMCGALVDSNKGFRQDCPECKAPLFKTTTWGGALIWMIDSDKIQLSHSSLWLTNPTSVQRMGEARKQEVGWLYANGDGSYLVKRVHLILQSAKTGVKIQELNYSNVDMVLHDGWIPSIRFREEKND